MRCSGHGKRLVPYPGQRGGIARYPGHIIIQEDVPAPDEHTNVDQGHNSSGSCDKEGNDKSVAGNNSITGKVAADVFGPRNNSLTNKERTGLGAKWQDVDLRIAS